MQPLGIVDFVDEAADLGLGMGQVAIGSAIDFLLFEGLGKFGDTNAFNHAEIR